MNGPNQTPPPPQHRRPERGPGGDGEGPEGPRPPRSPFRSPVFWVLLGVVALFWFQQYLLMRDVREIPYSRFKELVRLDKVDRVHIAGERIRGELKPGAVLLPEDAVGEGAAGEAAPPEEVNDGTAQQAPRGKPFVTVRVQGDDELIPLLEKHKIEYDAEVSSTWLQQVLLWVVPFILIIFLWTFLFRRMFSGGGPGAGILSFGKSRARLSAQHDVKVTFDDVAGIDEAKAELNEVVEFLKNPERYTRLGAKIPKGILLTGAPGTGKTLLARAVAGEAEVPFFSLSGSEFVEMFVGVGAARVRDLFAQAKKNAPCIVFVDEIDALGGRRGVNPMGGADEREQTLNQMLAEMDGFEPNSGIIIIAATNRPEVLDPALRRPGRFDRHIIVDSPDIAGREQILKVHTKQVRLEKDVDLRAIAARTPGFVGADLANLVNEAALTAARKKHDSVTEEDFDVALDRITTGIERKSRVLNPREKRLVAFHETGHALVAATLPGTDPVHKISIIPRSIGALGFTQQQPTEDRYLYTRTELENRLAVLLGGRTAEEIVFGEISTGAADDIQRATNIARQMIMRFGMSEKIGLLAFEEERNPYLGISQRGEFGEETANAIDAEVAAVVDRAHKTARKILTERRRRLDEIAEILLDKEHLEGESLKKLLAPEGEAGEASEAGTNGSGAAGTTEPAAEGMQAAPDEPKGA